MIGHMTDADEISVFTAEFGVRAIRLHGDVETERLRRLKSLHSAWATKIERWRSAGLDVYVYFDNDIKVKAPGDAMALAAKLGLRPASPGE